MSLIVPKGRGESGEGKSLLWDKLPLIETIRQLMKFSMENEEADRVCSLTWSLEEPPEIPR